MSQSASVEPARRVRVLVAQDQDGSQVLVDLWPDGTIDVAKRPTPSATWGPPLQIVREERS